MKTHFILLGAVALWLCSKETTLMAQTNQAEAQGWLTAANLAPEFKAPASLRTWDKNRKAIRTQLWSLLGDLPPRPKVPKVTILSREEKEGYVVEKFQFDNGAGSMVPGYVLLPQSAPKTKSPAILYCHWHGGQYDIGKEELFRTNAVPVPAGPALARKGFVVLGVDACCFGDRNGKGPGSTERGGAGEMSASKFNLWVGRTLWGMIVRDDLMALDYLCSRPEVDAKRIGVTGISMGATRTWWIMALDERPRTGVAVGCLTRYQNLVLNEGLKYHGIYYFVPGLLKHFDTEAVVALAAPRPMLFMTGDQDFGSPVDGINIIQSKVRPIYGLYDKPEDFQNVIYPGIGHVYLPEMWQKTVGWMEGHLK